MDVDPSGLFKLLSEGLVFRFPEGMIVSDLRFVHAADLHLDSPFTGLKTATPAHITARLLNATFEAYDRIIDFCLTEKVEALLIAGDIYDGADRSLRAQLRFVDGLKRLDAAGIRSFICHGNHDPLNGWQARLDLPPGCHQFGELVAAVPFDPSDPSRATVLGVSYPKREVKENLTGGFGTTARQGFSIGLLHCNAGGNSEHASYAPRTVSELAQTGIDYWALGHVHNHQILNSQNPTVVYPGNTQGRHINESGARGVYLVEVNSAGRVKADFHETSVLRWETSSVSIEGLETEQSLLDAIEHEVGALVSQSAGRDLIYRLALTGRGSLHEAARRSDFASDLQNRLNENWAGAATFAWCDRIDVLTQGPFDREARREASDFIGELLQLIDSARKDPALLSQLASDLRPLYGHARAGRFLTGEGNNPDDIASLLDDAEAACIEAMS